MLEWVLRPWPEQTTQTRCLRSVLFSYLEGEKPSPVVMVGSSIFANFIEEEVDRPIVNLGLDGANAATGLEILKRVGDRPEAVIVEMGLNSLGQSQGLHLEVLEWVESSHWTLWRRKWLHLSRRENHLHGLLRTKVRNEGTDKKVRGYDRVDPTYHRGALANFIDRQKRREAGGYYEREEMKAWLLAQRQRIDELMAAGVKVLLVRCAEDAPLHEARAMEHALELEHVPLDRYPWLDLNQEPGPWTTTDGIHPLREPSIRALKRMLEALDSQPLSQQ